MPIFTFVGHSLYQIICKCVKYILINPHFVPCKSAFFHSYFAFLRGRKMPSEPQFSAPRANFY